MSSMESASADLELAVDRYLGRIAQIDRMLEGPVLTLVNEVKEGLDRLDDAGKKGLPELRQWLSSTGPLDSQSSRVATSLCAVTLQRFHNVRRRFPGLKKPLEDLKVRRLSGRYYVERPAGDDDAYFATCCSVVDSKVHGALNPFTGAQVFRVLMETGEDRAHSGLGCLSFFAMVWPLFRKDPRNPLDLGARIEPSQPTAYVTAKCILPLIQLRQICERRATLTTAIRQNLIEMNRALQVPSIGRRWRFCSTLSDLIKNVGELAPISIGARPLGEAAKELDRLAGVIGRGDEALADVNRKALLNLHEALVEIGKKNEELIEEAAVVLERLRKGVVEPLREKRQPDGISGARWGFWPRDGSPAESYVQMQGEAAREAADLCDEILKTLRFVPSLKGVHETHPTEAVYSQVRGALCILARVNVRVAKLVYGPVELQAAWCHGVANREIAFTSADNDTDFDPAELVSSIAVGVRTHRFTTPVQLADAMRKAVLGAQRDGSWRLLHPFYSGDGSQSIRPPAADVVWTLASALSHFPEIDVADDALFRFVDWLERTQRVIQRPALLSDASGQAPYVGWSSDQMREDHRISLMTTAYAANALLAIRDLVEHRLWELCTRRFKIIRDARPLSNMDPVDLLVPHSDRLHRLLARMSWQTRVDAPRTPYSLVLHGPPGSSKTAVAGALARSLWTTSWHWARDKKSSRLIRVTPADFTRRGEAHVESEAQLIFRLLSGVRSVTVLFDEIDDLLRRREDDRPRFLDLVIPAMLNRLQDLRDVCPRQEMCFLFGTNYVERIEPALMRRGRIDRMVPVAYPDHESRLAIAERILEPFSFKRFDPQGGADVKGDLTRIRLQWGERIANSTRGWPWSAVTAVLEQVKDEVWRRVRKDQDERLKQKQKGDEAGQPRDGATDIKLRVEAADLEQAKLHFREVIVIALEENNPESQISSGYAERLEHRRESTELRREVLYSLVAEGALTGNDDLRPYLYRRVKGFGRDTAVRLQLIDAMERLPHAESSSWNSTGARS